MKVTSAWRGINIIDIRLHSLRRDPRPLLTGKPNSPISKISTGQEVVYGSAGDFIP